MGINEDLLLYQTLTRR